MASAYSNELIRRCDIAEERLCVAFNRWSDRRVIRQFFAIVSKLGNGTFWYALILSLPIIDGGPGFLRGAQLTVTALIGVVIYKWLKERFVRERPYISHLRIRVGTAPLDRYSFPSGHTLHAVSFAILFTVYYPPLAFVVVSFAVLVALSRVILGLHYPTDVAVGALLGASLAALSINLLP